MSESSRPAPAKPTSSFSAILAALTHSAKQENDSWDDGELADDVVTISYEQALRANRRFRLTESATEALPEYPEVPPSIAPASNPTPAAGKSRKTAGITLRLTSAEHAQLQERAAAAQLSVSAYLRSCIFEAESLRTQVKEALAQMQSAPAAPTSTVSGKSASPKWRMRFFPLWHRNTIESFTEHLTTRS